MTDILREDALEHFGVKGMHWGVRKNSQTGGSSGPSKAQKFATNRTEKAIRLHEKARDNKGVIGKVALIDKYTWGGNGRFEKLQNKRISQLENSVELISNGKHVASTILFGPQYTKDKAFQKKMAK
jgi:hypothetical protein